MRTLRVLGTSTLSVVSAVTLCVRSGCLSRHRPCARVSTPSLSELLFHGGFYPVSTPITAIRHRCSSFCTWPTYLPPSPESFSRCRLRWTTPPSPHTPTARLRPGSPPPQYHIKKSWSPMFSHISFEDHFNHLLLLLFANLRDTSKDHPPCHLSCYQTANDLKAHRLTTQPAAVQQSSYSQPSASKLLLSFHTTPLHSATCKTTRAGNFTTNYPVSAQSPWEKEKPYSLQSPHAYQTHINQLLD